LGDFGERGIIPVNFEEVCVKVYLATALLGLFGFAWSIGAFAVPNPLHFYVAPGGNDANPGTKARPFRTPGRAKEAVRAARAHTQGPITVVLRAGTYYLPEPLLFTAADSGTVAAPILWQAEAGEKVILSGGARINPAWKPWHDGILQTPVPANVGAFDQLFVNGKRQTLARYPNLDPAHPDKEVYGQAKAWKDVPHGYIHGLSTHRWGSLHYAFTMKDGVETSRRGGWQINRESELGDHYYENILEELDAPGEWYYDAEQRLLYYLPIPGLNLAGATLEAARLEQLIVLRGTKDAPVRHLTFQGITFTHTRRTLLEPYENLLRGDWSIHRSGAVFLEGAEDCSVEDCLFDQVGGNALFMSGYNRRNRVTGCTVREAGDSAFCLVGREDAVRTPSTWQNQLQEIRDENPGPIGPNYPAECLIHNNLIERIGRWGKQTAGVFLSMSEKITVSHNTIHDVPRAGICINDGTWGGHLIAFNDVYNTVQETGDHGPFNSWGRDRHWSVPNDKVRREFGLLDSHTPTVIRNNRFGHTGGHSWGIDLDDGSSNYRIFNNLCLGCSFKLREGYDRVVENNICIGPFPPGLHVWYPECRDIIRHNIIVSTESANAYEFIQANPAFAEQFDGNLFYNYRGAPTLGGLGNLRSFAQWQVAGYDPNSEFADPQFVDPAHGDYRVRPTSPAMKLGFKNFPMDQFGVLPSKPLPPGQIVIHFNITLPPRTVPGPKGV